MDLEAQARIYLESLQETFGVNLTKEQFEAAVGCLNNLLETVHEDGRDYEREGRDSYEYAVRRALGGK